MKVGVMSRVGDGRIKVRETGLLKLDRVWMLSEDFYERKEHDWN